MQRRLLRAATRGLWLLAMVITVHLHLHKSPILEEFRVGYRGLLASVAVLDDFFKKSDVVYFFHDGMGKPRLCRLCSRTDRPKRSWRGCSEHGKQKLSW